MYTCLYIICLHVYLCIPETHVYMYICLHVYLCVLETHVYIHILEALPIGRIEVYIVYIVVYIVVV